MGGRGERERWKDVGDRGGKRERTEKKIHKNRV